MDLEIYENNPINNNLKDYDYARFCAEFTWWNLPGLSLYVTKNIGESLCRLVEKVATVVFGIYEKVIRLPHKLMDPIFYGKNKFDYTCKALVPTLVGGAMALLLAGRSVGPFGVLVEAGISPLAGAAVSFVADAVGLSTYDILQEMTVLPTELEIPVSVVVGFAASTLILPGAAMSAIWINVAMTISCPAIRYCGGWCKENIYEPLKDSLNDLRKIDGVMIGAGINKVKNWSYKMLWQGISLTPSLATAAATTYLLAGKVILGTVLIPAGLTIATAWSMVMIPVVISRIWNAQLGDSKEFRKKGIFEAYEEYQLEKKNYEKNYSTFVNVSGFIGRVAGVAVTALIFPGTLPTVLTLSAVSLGTDYLIGRFSEKKKKEEEYLPL